jgi:hypothetical protein
MDCFATWPQAHTIPMKWLRQLRKHWLPAHSAVSEECGGCITECMTFRKVYQSTRHALHPFNHSQMAGETIYETIKELLWKVFVQHEKDCDGSLSIFLLLYRASSNDNTHSTPVNPVFRQEIWMPCYPLLGAHSGTISCDKINVPLIRLTYLKLVSEKVKIQYVSPANYMGYHEGDTQSRQGGSFLSWDPHLRAYKKQRFRY